MTIFRIPALLILLALPISPVAGEPVFPDFDECTAHIHTTDGRRILIHLSVASTPRERQQGLMGVGKIPANSGMIFIFSDEQYRNFWMKNTPLPLSIAFLDRNGRIIDIQHMAPWSLQTTSSRKPAQYAIEVPKGWFDRLGIFTGARVEFNGCISKQD